MRKQNPSPPWCGLRVDPERMKSDFDELAEIGGTPDGGVHRPAWSPAHKKAREWFLEKAGSSGLETRIDGAGNHIAALWAVPGKSFENSLLLGSHLDSVPHGGRFDGALGVVAGLEVLRTIRENRIEPGPSLELYDFSDEEGRFFGLMGSQAAAGLLTQARLEQASTEAGSFRAALEEAGLNPESILSARRERRSLAGYLELHVEQGPRLEQAGADIGIVSAIVGIRSFRLVFVGRPDHAGTTPLEQRFDAGLGAAAFNLAAHRHVGKNHPGCVVTVGDMEFSPGAFNVVPKAVTLSLEFRAETAETLDVLESELLNLAAEQAQAFGLALEFVPMERAEPVRLDQGCQDTIALACRRLGLKTLTLPSGAGHDAQSLARICPAGMIFVPSAGGASHSPREFSEWEACLRGADALLQTALSICLGPV